jgi:uncharacterized DUF497 family protein
LTNYGKPVSSIQDETFEWDDKKAARNWRDHAISFEMGRAAFNDGFAVIRVDNYHDDEENDLPCSAW